MSAEQYLTLDQVKGVLKIDVTATATDAVLNAQLTALIIQVSRSIDAFCKRHFYRLVQTRVFDVPPDGAGHPGRLWLDRDLLDVTSLVGGDVTIDADRYVLCPVNHPVYRWIELRWESYPSQRWSTKTERMRQISVTGGWGYITPESQQIIPLACQLWIQELTSRYGDHPGAQSVSIGDFSVSYGSMSEQRIQTPAGETILMPPGQVAGLLRGFMAREIASVGR